MQASLNPVADSIAKLVATAIKYQEVSVAPPEALALAAEQVGRAVQGLCLVAGDQAEVFFEFPDLVSEYHTVATAMQTAVEAMLVTTRSMGSMTPAKAWAALIKGARGVGDSVSKFLKVIDKAAVARISMVAKTLMVAMKTIRDSLSSGPQVALHALQNLKVHATNLTNLCEARASEVADIGMGQDLTQGATFVQRALPPLFADAVAVARNPADEAASTRFAEGLGLLARLVGGIVRAASRPPEPHNALPEVVEFPEREYLERMNAKTVAVEQAGITRKATAVKVTPVAHRVVVQPVQAMVMDSGDDETAALVAASRKVTESMTDALDLVAAAQAAEQRERAQAQQAQATQLQATQRARQRDGLDDGRDQTSRLVAASRKVTESFSNELDAVAAAQAAEAEEQRRRQVEADAAATAAALDNGDDETSQIVQKARKVTEQFSDLEALLNEVDAVPADAGGAGPSADGAADSESIAVLVRELSGAEPDAIAAQTLRNHARRMLTQLRLLYVGGTAGEQLERAAAVSDLTRTIATCASTIAASSPDEAAGKVVDSHIKVSQSLPTQIQLAAVSLTDEDQAMMAAIDVQIACESLAVAIANLLRSACELAI